MKKIVLGIVGVIVLAVIIAGVWLYTGDFSDNKAQAFKQLSLPVAVVKSKIVTGRELTKRMELAQLLYGDNPDFKENITKKNILEQLISDAKLVTVAQDHKVNASNTDIDSQYEAIVKEFADGDESRMEETLAEKYHMKPKEFKAQLIQPDVLLSNLTIWYYGQKDLNQSAYDKLSELQGKLDSGQPFEEVVKAYTQDEATKDFGGDMGFVPYSEFAPEFRTALKDAKNGDRLTIVSRYGLHIMQVLEVDRSQQEPSYHIQQIFIEGGNFQDWYQKQADAVKSYHLIKV